MKVKLCLMLGLGQSLIPFSKATTHGLRGRGDSNDLKSDTSHAFSFKIDDSAKLSAERFGIVPHSSCGQNFFNHRLAKKGNLDAQLKEAGYCEDEGKYMSAFYWYEMATVSRDPKAWHARNDFYDRNLDIAQFYLNNIKDEHLTAIPLFIEEFLNHAYVKAKITKDDYDRVNDILDKLAENCDAKFECGENLIHGDVIHMISKARKHLEQVSDKFLI